MEQVPAGGNLLCFQHTFLHSHNHIHTHREKERERALGEWWQVRVVQDEKWRAWQEQM